MASQIPGHDVPGYPDIEVGADLIVRSKARTTEFQHSVGGLRKRHFPAKVLSVFEHGAYLAVFVHSARKTVGLHRIICLAFHGDPPPGKPLALHRDGDTLNNDPSNLYWGDHRDNALDARRHGTLAFGCRHGSRTHPETFASKVLKLRKLTPAQVEQIRDRHVLRHPEFGGKALAAKFGVHPATIRRVLAGTTYKGV